MNVVRKLPLLGIVTVSTGLIAACFGQGQPTPTSAPPPQASPVSSPAASPAPSPAASPKPSAPAPDAPGTQSHTVAEGETLRAIAQQYYEDGELWRKIFDANRDTIGDNPDAIKIGQTLKIPPK